MAGGDDRIIARCAKGMSFREAMMYDGLLLWPGDRGKTFYVDTTLGSPTNGGERPDDALDTITDALALCVADRRDTVFVLNWGTDNGETWPLPMSVAGVTLLGASAGSLRNVSQAYIVCPNNVAVIALSAARCRIMNLYLQCPVAYDAITFSGPPTFTGIIGNFFGPCNDAIGGGDAASTTIGSVSEISFNMFSQSIRDHGIYVYNPPNLLIRNNVFDKVRGTYALYITNAGRPRVFDNRFFLNSDTEGSAIYSGSAVLGGHFDGNHASFGRVPMTENPYIDIGSDDNDWGLNYAGIVPVLPAYGF